MSGVGKKSLPRSWRWTRAHRLGEQRKRGWGGHSGRRKKGQDCSFLTHSHPYPPTHFILAAGPGLPTQ